MRTKKINIYEQQMQWERWHMAAGAIIEIEKKSGRIARAIYESPLERWKEHIDPLGEVAIPDIDYYNTLTNEKDIKIAIEEIFGE
jgi:hypothetical protein